MSDNKQVTVATPSTSPSSAATEQDQQRAVLLAVDVFKDAAGITLDSGRRV